MCPHFIFCLGLRILVDVTFMSLSTTTCSMFCDPVFVKVVITALMF